MRCSIAFAILMVMASFAGTAAQADHCMSAYHRAAESMEAMQAKYAGTGDNARMSCADVREVLRVLTMFANMDKDSCSHASSYHLYVELSENIALAKRYARQLKREMRGKC